jgi:hypothetical protein
MNTLRHRYQSTAPDLPIGTRRRHPEPSRTRAHNARPLAVSDARFIGDFR